MSLLKLLRLSHDIRKPVLPDPLGINRYLEAPEERSLHLDIFRGDDQPPSDQETAFRIDDGFAGELGIDLYPGQSPIELLEEVSGIVVYRSTIFGLLVFRWSIRTMETMEDPSASAVLLQLPFTQLSDDACLANPELERVRPGGFVVAWIEPKTKNPMGFDSTWLSCRI